MDAYIICFAVAAVVWNITVFIMFGRDKKKSKKNTWRISERTLLRQAFFFGAVGAYFGMKVFRHKTAHNRFRILVPLFILVNALLYAGIYYIYVSYAA